MLIFFMTKGKSEYSKSDGKILLKFVRESIREEFNHNKPEFPKDKKFQDKQGVFVTLKEKNTGSLRGCIGFPYPYLPLNEAVYRAAKEAAFSDSRFSKLREDELKNIQIEISILSLPEEIEIKDEKQLKKIKIGEDGLICNYSGYSGLLLPQVATEHNMNQEQFIDCLCNKAGLSKGTWKEKAFKLYKFQAQIFNE
jgi:hypothetical protein